MFIGLVSELKRQGVPNRVAAVLLPNRRVTGVARVLEHDAVAGARFSGKLAIVQTDSVELTISVPAFLADADAAERARILLVLDAVRSERMTWRAAAGALGIAPDQLLDLARVHGVPVVRYESADLRDDLLALAKLERLRAPGA